jgi:hypothetical protein
MLRVVHRSMKFARLDPLRRRYLYEAIGHLAWARLELRRKPAGAILDGLQRNISTESADHKDADDLALLSWAIRAGGSGVPWRSDCLVQSLAADRWLMRKGIVHNFRLGVRQGDSGQVLAHAWIEVDGFIITGGDEIVDYRLLTSN